MRRVRVQARRCPKCGEYHVLASDVNTILALAKDGATVTVEDTVLIHRGEQITG